MKIDSDLRAVIRSAERSQPGSDFSVREQQQQAAVADLVKRRPVIRRLLNKANQAASVVAKLDGELCQRYGLRRKGADGLDIAYCDESKQRFVKAGGKLPLNPTGKWKADAVIAELAGADSKKAKAILAKYGIKWE